MKWFVIMRKIKRTSTLEALYQGLFIIISNTNRFICQICQCVQTWRWRIKDLSKNLSKICQGRDFLETCPRLVKDLNLTPNFKEKKLETSASILPTCLSSLEHRAFVRNSAVSSICQHRSNVVHWSLLSLVSSRTKSFFPLRQKVILLDAS